MIRYTRTLVLFSTLLTPIAARAAAPSPFAPQTLSGGTAAATERAEHYEAALARAKATGKDLVVLQHGSDWNVCGEKLYRNVWSTEAFVKALGDGFVLVAIDNPETPNEAAKKLQPKNAGFTWFDGGHCPRIALMDAQGRAIASDSRPRSDLTPQTMAARIHTMRDKRLKRDALWAAAEKAQGPAKAELLRQSLAALDLGNDEAFGRNNGWVGPNGNDKHYAFVHDAMRQADPHDQSGAIRWLGFGLGAWGAVAWAPENQWWTKLDGKPHPNDADYTDALDCIDRELKDPRNRLLQNEHVQHIMKARFDVYLRKVAGKHDDEVLFQIQREIAALDPTTFWGIGAVGYLGMYHRTASPFLVYGWEGERQLKTGANRWTLLDTPYFLDHAGAYKFTMTTSAGTDHFTVKRVALVDGKDILAQAAPAAGKNDVAAGHPLELQLDCRAWRPDRRYALEIDYESQEGHRNNNGSFAIEPLLDDE
jgi:hypothetical protein